MAESVSLNQFTARLFSDHLALLNKTETLCGPALNALIQLGIETITMGGKLMFFGNGGSAADAQHLATELAVRYLADRSAVAAIALTTDTSTLTAAANDLGFDLVFSRQIEALGTQGDLAIGITTSGRSGNVINALKKSKSLGLHTAVLCGKEVQYLSQTTDVLVSIPSSDTPRVQEMHILLGHIFCHALERQLVGDNFD